MGTPVGSSRAKAREASGRREEKAQGRLCGIVRALHTSRPGLCPISIDSWSPKRQDSVGIAIFQRKLGLRNVFTIKFRTVKTEARKIYCPLSNVASVPGTR